MFRLSSTLKIEEEAMVAKTQGIGSILGSDSEKSKSCSLRRTLSADMSNKKWPTQHGFSAMKKIASSKEFSIPSEGQEENKEVDEKPGEFDIWSSIILQKAQDANKSLPPPYVHPLVKRSASSLSEKSLQICTESLGSETGSDGFSSYPSSETGDTDDDKEMDQEEALQQTQPQQQQEEERMTESIYVEAEIDTVPKYKYQKSPQRSFPPPISSLSCHDGASIRMQSRRDNGRLVLEAVSVSSANNFRAQRHDGRLVLTFVNATEMEDEEEEEEKFEEEEEEEEHEETEEELRGGEMEIEFVMDREAPKLSNKMLNLHRLTLVMNNKQMGLAKRNPPWPNKFNEVVKFDEENDMKPSILAQSLPSRATVARLIPKPAAAVTVGAASGATFNAYEYYWKPKPLAGPALVSKQMMNQQIQQNGKIIVSRNKNSVENEQQQILLWSGKKGDYLVPLTKACKEPRRSLLFWEPNCIATS
ncbi:protein FAF-like, chloroplastic [Mangifera indica]|uniref:protein FAF-like, chloroplastic n=1 Tax=Mangifera indica TaxID=29780 RepID=UPI001CFAA22D|nr:protein FAF-like, chloroplastic [Mangifera indica]